MTRPTDEGPVTRDTLLAWLKAQEPSTRFNLLDNYDCVVARFLKATGHSEVDVGGYTYDCDGVEYKLNETVSTCAVYAGTQSYRDVIDNLEDTWHYPANPWGLAR